MSKREIQSVRVIYRDGGQWEYGPAHFSLLPDPDRLALARALVADMPGVVVAEDVGEMPDIKTWDDYRNGERDGWNAARTAMLATPEADNAGS